MAPVNDRQSAWHGFTPVPRMVQNQLGHLLELRMIDLDRKVLPVLQKMLERRDRHSWVVITLSLFILLHVRELDAARNIFWGRYKDSVGSYANYWRGGHTDTSSMVFGFTLPGPPASLKKRLHLVVPYCLIITAQLDKPLSL